MRLGAVSYVVRDYDEAIDWFTRCLGFVLLEDAQLGGGKRWVCVGTGDGGTAMALAKAVDGPQVAAIGKAAGGRVAFFLHVEDFGAVHARMLAAGVTFREQPRHESYGTVAVFEDLYGNPWDLIEKA